MNFCCIENSMVKEKLEILRARSEVVVPRCSSKQMFLKILQISQALESLFNKVAVQKVCNFIEKRLQHRCFLVKFAKYFRTPSFTELLWWLILYVGISLV